MTDYRAVVAGHFENGDPWSFSWNITSNQTMPALLTTWSNAWIAAWTNGTYGLNTLYPTTTVMDTFTVYTLNGQLKATFKDQLISAQAGGSSDNGLPNEVGILVEKLSPSIAKTGRGFTYLPAPVEGVVVNGTYTVASMIRVKTAVTSVVTAVQADGSTLFVYPRVAPKSGIGVLTKTVWLSVRLALKPTAQTRREDALPGQYV